MSNFLFSEMTPELQRYLDLAHAPGAAREALVAARGQVPEDLLKRYQAANKSWLCRDETRTHEPRTVTSPSGHYHLVTTTHSTGKGTWAYTKGQVFDGKKLIQTVCRNYPAFPHLFVEGHPNGHDYLVCGEDYQGQTILELDTGKRRDYLPAEAEQGHGFCWAEYTVSPSKRTLAVGGCYWACPYEVHVIDFDRPMEELPFLHRSELDSVDGWEEGAPDTLHLCGRQTFCTHCQKPYDDLTEEEWALPEHNDGEHEEERAVGVTLWTR